MAEENRIEEHESSVKIPQELPLLALKNSVVFPFLATPLVVGRKKSIDAINNASKEHKIIVVVAQKEESKEQIEKEDLYEVGTACAIKQVVNISEDEIKCVVEGIARVRIKYFTQVEPYLFASYLLTETKQKQEILEEANIQNRLKKLTDFLSEELRKFEVQSQIRDKVQKEVGTPQREYYLRQQLKAIKDELGESDESFELITELEKKLSKKDLPKDAKEKVKKEIKRLETMSTMSPEYSYIRTYIDWMLDIPWSEKTKDVLDLKKAKTVLDSDHYDLEKVKEHILDYLAVRKLKGKTTKGPILCFVGPPGVGKTSLGQSIAKSMGRKFIRMSIGGIRDEA